MRRALTIAGVLTSMSLCSCALSVEHMFGTDDSPRHPWHQWPAHGAMMLVGAPLFVLCLPLIALEELTDTGSFASKTNPGLSTYLVAGPSITVGYVIGLPFLALALPWELGVHAKREPAPEEVEPEVRSAAHAR